MSYRGSTWCMDKQGWDLEHRCATLMGLRRILRELRSYWEDFGFLIEKENMQGIDFYVSLYPQAKEYLDSVQIEVVRDKVIAPTEWAREAIYNAFIVDITKSDPAEPVLHIDEFDAKLFAYYQHTCNKVRLALHKKFGLPFTDEGECASDGLEHWITTGFCEADVLRRQFDEFFDPDTGRYRQVPSGSKSDSGSAGAA